MVRAHPHPQREAMKPVPPLAEGASGFGFGTDAKISSFLDCSAVALIRYKQNRYETCLYRVQTRETDSVYGIAESPITQC